MPGGAPPPRPPRSRTGLIVGTVAAVVVVCLLLGVGAVVALRGLVRQGSPNGAEPSHAIVTMSPTDESGPGESGAGDEQLGLGVGEGAEFAKRWSLAVTGVEWYDRPCTGPGRLEHPVVVLEMTFEAHSGSVRLHPTLNFVYITDSGIEAEFIFFNPCDLPEFYPGPDYEVAAGERLTGKMAFAVPGGEGGRLEYRSTYDLLSGPGVSWIVPGQS